MTEKSTFIKILEIEQDSHCEKFCLLKAGLKQFCEIAELFPSSIKKVKSTEEPKIGCAWYIENERGFMVLYKNNWDQS